MKKPVKLALLCVLLVAVVAGGVFLLTKGSRPETAVSSGSSAPSAAPTVADSQDFYYTEKIVAEYDMYSTRSQRLYSDNGTPLRLVESPDGSEPAHLVTLDTQQTAITLPEQVDWKNEADFCIDSKKNVWIVFYDTAKKQFYACDYDRTGKPLGHKIYFPDYKMITQTVSESITKLSADDSFFYFYYEDTARITSTHKERNSFLCVFDQSGKQVFRKDKLGGFEIDYHGNCYLVGNDQKNLYFEKLEVKAQRVPWSDKQNYSFPENVDLWYVPSTQSLYFFGTSGAWRCLDNRKSLPGNVQEIFKVGNDSSFTPSEYAGNRKTIFSHAADEKGRLYFITGNRVDNSKNDKHYWHGIVYQFTPGKVTANLAHTFTVTAPYQSAFLSDAVSRYERTHPGKHIKLDCTYETESDYGKAGKQYAQQLRTKILAGDIGDVVWLGETMLPFETSAFRTDAFLDLTDKLKSDLNYKNLNQNVLNGMKQGGAIRALPVSSINTGYDVNLTLMRKAGVDITAKDLKWSRLLSIAQDWDSRKTGYSLLVDMGSSDYYLQSILIANLPDLVDFDSKAVGLNQPWFLDLMKRYKSAFQGKSFTCKSERKAEDPDLFSSALQPNILLSEEDVSYSRMLISSKCTWFKGFTEKTGIEHTYIPIPCGEKHANRYAVSGDVAAISSRSQKQAEAWDFLSFLLASDVQQLDTIGGTPINLAVYGTIKEKSVRSNGFDVNFTKMLDPIYENVDRMFYPDDILSELTEPMSSYANGQMSLDDAVKQAQSRIERTLDE